MVEHLPPADLKLCMDALAALKREDVKIFTATFKDRPHKRCMTHDECRAGLRALEDTVLRGKFGKHRDVWGRPDSISMDVAKRVAGIGVCERYQKMLLKHEYALRDDVWRRLLAAPDV